MSNWLIGITCAALLAAVARSLMPAGAVRQVGNLICALLLLFAVLKPLKLNVDLDGTIGDITSQIQKREQELEKKSGQILKTLIEQESGAYIVDKAAQLGVVCSAQVSCAFGAGGVWLPARVRISGQFTPEQRRTMEEMISAELGIEASEQEFTGGD